jgi:predicted ATPase/DNA-binding SARP family transcriptional activator
MAILTLNFLGPWQVHRADGEPAGLGYDKVRALLAFLAVENGRAHSREALTALLWPELPQAAARNNLRQVLHTLREGLADRLVDPPYLLTSRASIQFNPHSPYHLDVESFTTAVTDSQAHGHRNAASCHTCARRLARAVDLYRGPFLQDFFLPDSAAFEEWAAVRREGLSRQMLVALERLVAFYERRGHYERALQYTHRQLEIEPWREAAHRRVMGLHVLRGERNAALAQYAACRALLAEELGVEPEAATTQLYERIKTGGENLVHRMEAGLAPPGKTPGSRAFHVPLPPTPFIGRQVELEQIAALIDGEHCRLLTLAGPGGVGKTRLALQTAADQRHNFPDGIYFVNLASLHTLDMLVQSIADATGLDASGPGDASARLIEQLRGKDLFLILDNFEHLREGIDLLGGFLRAAPHMMLLVTSRERLNLRGETVLTVEGFSTPNELRSGTELEALLHSDAVQLFLQGARRAQPAFDLPAQELGSVVDICRLVGGLPLAIELAAAWTRYLTPAEIAAEIAGDPRFLQARWRDLPERHRDLWAVFDHSWALLTPEEQAVLSRLAVFPVGFERAAADEVAGADLSTLASLTDKSLLQRHPSGRYQWHPLFREYVQEKLLEGGESPAARWRHFQYFLDLAESAENAGGQEQVNALERLATENENLAAALEFARERGEVQAGLRLAVALYRFWNWRSHFREGCRWFDAFLADSAGLPDELLARAYFSSGVLSVQQKDYGRAEAHLNESLSLRRTLGDERGQAACLNSLGILAWSQEEYERAGHLLERSLSLRKATGDPNLGPPLNNLGLVALARGDLDRAEGYFSEQLAWARHNQVDMGIAIGLSNLGATRLEQDRPEEARTCFRQSLGLFQKLGDLEGIAGCLEGLAAAAVRRGQAERAVQLSAAAENLRRQINAPLAATERHRYERTLASAQELLGEPRFTQNWTAGSQLSVEQAISLATALPGR